MTPSAASTSAEPEREEIDRLPCLATGTPAPATTKAAQVEMLKRALGVAAGAAGVDGAVRRAHRAAPCARMARAAPVISSTVSPRTRSAISSAPICASRRRARHDQLEGFGRFVLCEALARRDLGDGAAQIGERRRPCRARD